MDRKRKMEKVTSIAMVAVIVSALFGAIVIPASAAGEVTVTRSYVQGTESGTAIVTVTYTVNTAIGSIGIKENIPTDWTITEQTSSPATTYRPATHEWICIGPPGVGESGTITYTVSGPAGDAGTISGTYDIGEGPVDTPSTSVTLKNGVGSITVTRTSALGTEAGTAVVTLSYSVNTAIGSIGIKENIPTDWTITEQTSSPATTYRPATHEWICIGPPGVGESGTITYTVSGPVGDTDTISGTYDIGEGPVGTPSTSVTLKGEGPTIVSYTISLQTITPPETTEIDVEFSERVEAWIKIEDVDRNLVNELYHSTGVTDPSPKTWDGTYTDGTVVPAGDYYVNVTGLNTTTGLSVVNNTQTITVEGPSVPHVVINEFIAGPATLEHLSDEIELYNPTDAEVDLTGWTISSPPSSVDIASLDGMTIPANGYLVLVEAYEFSFPLSSVGDIIVLKNGATIVDQVAYGDYDDGNIADNAPAPGADNSTGRYPNGVDTDVDIDDFRVFTTPTIGASNTPPEDTTPPVVTNPTATPDSISAGGTTGSQLSVTVTDDSEIHSVTINLSAIGGSATTVMSDMGDNVYSVTTTAAVGTEGSYNLPVNATDIYGNSNTDVSIPLTVEPLGLPPTVFVYTDTTFYMEGNTMHVGLDVTNPGGDLPVRLAVWLELPDGGIYVLTYTSVTLPAGLTYSNPDFAVITLPSLATGTYIWNAALIAPTGPIEPPFIDDDTWDWYFYSSVGTETPTEDIATVLEQAKTTVVIDFGK